MHDETVESVVDFGEEQTPSQSKKKYPWDYYCKDSECSLQRIRQSKPSKKKDRYGVYRSDKIRAIRLFENGR